MLSTLISIAVRGDAVDADIDRWCAVMLSTLISLAVRGDVVDADIDRCAL
jgi:hypothetical protein